MIPSFTNSSLSTARRCLREFQLRYPLQLERAGPVSEALDVGSAWHAAFEAVGTLPLGSKEAQAIGCAEIEKRAPGELWSVKLRRLFAAYEWRYRADPLRIIKPEHTFEIVIAGVTFRGQIDSIVELPDGRRGILERKTTSDGVDDESSYWDRLRLDTQVGIYSLACEFEPQFILYDVVRKPTINPKGIAAKDLSRMRAEMLRQGFAYYFENFPGEEIERALHDERETPELYGARLTNDIGERPDYYFRRRSIARTAADYDSLKADLLAQVEVLEFADERALWPRNPDSCNVFGLCQFFALCSNNVAPPGFDPTWTPDGYRRRKHLHPELDGEDEAESE